MEAATGTIGDPVLKDAGYDVHPAIEYYSRIESFLAANLAPRQPAASVSASAATPQAAAAAGSDLQRVEKRKTVLDL